VADRFGNSAQLWFTTVVFSLALAFPIGIISAVKRNSWFDHGSTAVTLMGISLPDFWLGLMLLLVFSLALGWLPTSGNAGELPVLQRAPYFILPTLVLSLQLLPFYARFLRTSLYEVLLREYIVTARAKGLSQRLIVSRHALRNALLPMVTIIGFSIPRLVGAAVIVESIFAWPGVGRLALDAALRRDYPAIMGVTMVTFLFVVLTNLVVDVLYTFIDPRISFGHRGR
jgi:peptide/nickel transport system permease protein